MAALMSAAQVKPSSFSANNLFRGPKTGRVSAVRAERSGVNQLTVSSIRQQKLRCKVATLHFNAIKWTPTQLCTRAICVVTRRLYFLRPTQNPVLFDKIFPLFHNFFATPGNFRAKQ